MTSLADLKAGIERTRAVTDREVAGAAEHMPKAIDVLLQLPRAGGAPAAEEDSVFRFWALSVYVNSAHTCWALYDLCRSGLYYEATILLRNLMEALVQLRYFETRKSEVVYLLNETKRFKIWKMFEAVAPGYHDRWYGLLSSTAHARLAATLYRVDATRLALGAQYNEILASVVLNQFDPVLLGLLRLFPHHFPGYVSVADPALEARRVEEVDWLQTAFDAQVQQFPRSAEWADLVRPLIRV
jgi:Family of unknown function (DUF5677)